MVDAEIDTVTRAFDTAFGRMCSASSTEELADELSNMLHHLYRFFWIRTFDTHEVAVVATLGDLFSDYFTEMFRRRSCVAATDLDAVHQP